MTKLYYTIFNLIAVAVIIFLGVDSFYRIAGSRLSSEIPGEISVKRDLKKEAYRKPPLSSYDVIKDKNIFSKVETLPEQDDVGEIEALEPTSLSIALRGTSVISGSQENSFAVIEDKTTRLQKEYYVGDSIQNGTVRKILNRKIVLKVGDEDEILEMEEFDSSGAGSAPGVTPVRTADQGGPALERTITIRREEIDSSLADLNGLLTQASIRPHFSDGVADGIAVTSVKAGSIFRRMGIRNGDIVRGVSGNQIRSPEDLISLYDSLKSQSEISLEILRRGQDMKMNYRFR